MILTLIGLILSFIASVGLLLGTLFNLGNPKNAIYSFIYDRGKIKPMKPLEKQKDGSLKQVKITNEEARLLIWLSILCIGFLFQILDIII